MSTPEESVFKKLEPFMLLRDSEEDSITSSSRSASSSVRNLDTIKFKSALPLMPAKVENIQPNAHRISSISKKIKLEHANEDSEQFVDVHEELLAKLSHQSSVLKEQAAALTKVNSSAGNQRTKKEGSPASSLSDQGISVQPLPIPIVDEVERLKRELDAAKEQLAKQDQELHKSRIISHVLEQTHSNHGKDMLKSPTRLSIPIRQDLMDDSKSDISEAMSNYSRGINAWDSVSQVGTNHPQQNIWSTNMNKPWTARGMPSTVQPMLVPHHGARNYPGMISPSSPENSAFLGTAYPIQLGNRPRTNSGGRVRNGQWGGNWTAADVSGMIGLNGSHLPAMGSYQNQPIGTRSAANSTLSAMAPEFSLEASGNLFPPSLHNSSFAQPNEPLNYRKLLDRSVSCNWKYIVDKIVCGNDQQASIFLQQKLKVGTAEQKFEIVEAIVAQAYPLMVNRFGNFLVQRCFEHGTPEQVIAIANAIRGNTLSLSMDAFGCHVVQKAFDAVPEEYKAIMVHELLRSIPDTVIHRYACHVWQKLFELRWSDAPPQIMKHVNLALRGMWHEVALGETGSLVVQNIFENCLEDDKRPCIDEVLQSIDIVAHGQFGNWCIQHICEHGAPADRSRAVDHVLRFATEYSMDQFASKVVEKCLKIGSNNFLERYLERVCEGRTDRPRIPLIDIASDQYGNYLIQYILTHANSQHRETVASHIRKHMVSLRGSKFGSRVGLLCCNPAYATRPGPPVPVSSGRFPGLNNAGSNPGQGPASAGTHYAS